MEKPLGHLCNQEKPIHISSMWHVRPEKTNKRLIIANNNLYLLKSASTDLIIQIQLKLINTKRWGIFIVTTWLEGWLTKPKETPSHHEVRLTPQDSHSVFIPQWFYYFLCLWFCTIVSWYCSIFESVLPFSFLWVWCHQLLALRRTSEMSTPPKLAKGTYFHMQHGTKTVSAFLTADGEAFYSLLSILVSWLSCNTVQHENTYFCILWKAKKGLSINNNHNYHQCLSR